MATERLQKILARGGIASRRSAEALIKAGRVRVNGKIVTELGTKADSQADKVEIDGTRVVHESAVYVVLHKPRGVVSTMSDPEGRPSVKELLDGVDARVYPVGRLDFATSGVLLCTNDGEFAEGLMHPTKAVPKTYVLKVSGNMLPEDIERWRTGIRLEDGMTLPAKASLLRHDGDKTWLELTIREGRNQQIRRMGDATRFPVMRLARTSFAGITSEGIRPGGWRYLTRDELSMLKKDYGVPKRLIVQEAAPEVGRRGRAPGKNTHDHSRPRPGARGKARAPATREERAATREERGRRGPEGREEDRAAGRRGPNTHARRRPAAGESRARPRGDDAERTAPDARGPGRAAPRGEDRAAAPRGERSAPVRGDRRERGAPVRGERSAPVRGERSAPVRGERSAPVRGERGAPVRGERGAPVRAGRGAPVRGERSAPRAERAPRGDKARPAGGDERASRFGGAPARRGPEPVRAPAGGRTWPPPRADRGVRGDRPEGGKAPRGRRPAAGREGPGGSSPRAEAGGRGGPPRATGAESRVGSRPGQGPRAGDKRVPPRRR
jgi:23S rRNA pseudouridine2605 synthase